MYDARVSSGASATIRNSSLGNQGHLPSRASRSSPGSCPADSVLEARVPSSRRAAFQLSGPSGREGSAISACVLRTLAGEDVAHGVATGRLAQQPGGDHQRTARKDVGRSSAVRELDALTFAEEEHRVLSGHVTTADSGVTQLIAR